MPIYHHFYVERRVPEGWIVPADFKPEAWTFKCDHPFGEFAWAHPRAGWLDLFFGVDPLFPMRPGPPDDRRSSPLLQHLDQFYDYRLNEDWLCWIPYSELVVGCWDTDLVTVGTKVPARYALLFGDGRQSFPRSSLLGAGASDKEVERLRDGHLVTEPVDVTYGRQRFRITELPPDEPVEVTWRATIAEFIGERCVSLFKGLRQYGPDDDLRLLSRRG
jgi:hypothetical protein